MHWATESKSIPWSEIGWTNSVYLANTTQPGDPTMVWGTSVDLERMDQFLAAQSRQSNLMISIVHVMILAVGRSLSEHPKLNRRVIGWKLYPYKRIGMAVPIRRPFDGIVDLIYFNDVRPMSLRDIADRVWNESRDRALKAAQERKAVAKGLNWKQKLVLWIKHLQLTLYTLFINFTFWCANHFRGPTWGEWDEVLNGANAFVNFLGFNGAPPMISYKPSSLAMNSFGVSVTMGLPEQKPVVQEGKIVIRKMAPVFVRVDHRLVNGHQAASFVATLRSYLSQPESLLVSEAESSLRDLASAA